MEIDTLTIQAELERILSSRCFRSSKSSRKFLHYIVTASLTGNPRLLTQHAIAVEGLGKHTDFDDIDNPLVRVQAGRVRKQLNDYYATEGRYNSVCIQLPRGSYQPVFMRNQPEPSNLLHVPADISFSQSQGPAIVCIPRTFTVDEINGWLFITRLVRDYVTALTHFSFCQILFADETPWQQANWPKDTWHKYGADFALFLDLHSDKSGYSLKCSLVHRQNDQILWAHSFSLGKSYPEPATINSIFKRIAHDTIAYDPGVTHTHWVRQMLDAGKPIASHHQVLVAVRQYIWEPSPVAFRTSFRACEQRLEKIPHDTQALFVYANHCFTEYAMKFNIVESPHTRLAYAADALLQHAPRNAFSHAYHALVCLLEEEDGRCRTALEKAQAINPLDTYLNVHIGLIYLALGDWQMGAKLIQDSINVSPVYPDWYHIPLSIYHYREGHYLTAMQEVQQVRLKYIWTPMLRTALYQCNQKLEKGAKEYLRMVNEYPDFSQTNRKITQDLPQKINNILSKLWSHLPS
jgi:hypothetical protein